MTSVLSYTELEYSRSVFSDSHFLKIDCRATIKPSFSIKAGSILPFVSVSFSAARITKQLDETTDDQLNEIMASWQRFLIEYNLRRFVRTSRSYSRTNRSRNFPKRFFSSIQTRPDLSKVQPREEGVCWAEGKECRVCWWRMVSLLSCTPRLYGRSRACQR